MITFNNTKTIYDLVKNVGREYENKVFIRFEKDDAIFEKGYGTYATDTLAVAAYINDQSEKLKHEVHGAILGKCSYEYLTVLLGIPCAGGISIPMDIKQPVETMAENLKKADTDILFYDREFSVQADLLKKMCPFIKRFVCLNSRKNTRCVTMIHKVYRGIPLKVVAKADACAMIIFTSGTTGKGKGVMLSHANVIDNMFCTDDEEEVCLNVLPIHHVFCISGDVFMVLRYGSTLCLCDDISKMLYYIDLFKPSVIRLVPMIAKMLVNRVNILMKKEPELTISDAKERVMGRRLNRIVSGGGYLSEALSSALFDLGIVTGQGYGMSECSPKISVPEYGRKDKIASVGHLVTGCKARVVDGEIQVSSPSVMMGYYNDPELTKEAFTEDGWLRTGDIGYVDDEGFIFLNGRRKNLIILSNGENVSPEMIENHFDEDRIVADIIVYGKGDVIAAEVYPNYEYAQVNGIYDIEAAIREIVAKHNDKLPSYAQIAECTIRKTAFKKTSSNKIIRDVYFNEKSDSVAKQEDSRKPENDIQRKLYELVSDIIGNTEFGIDDNFYQCGLDSLGSTLLVVDLSTEFKVNIKLSELMDNPTILDIEKLISAKQGEKPIDISAREVYPLTAMQKYFAYIIPGNTTGNLPFVYKLDKEVNLEKLRNAIYKVLNAHPSLKAVVKPTEQKYYAIFRNDSRKLEIPIEKIDDDVAEEKMQELIVPFRYRADDNLVHIYLFEGAKYNYMFFDVAHFMGDGVSMNIIMEDLSKAYKGEEIEVETYTTYEYILEEQEREKNGVRENDIKYISSLMEGLKLDRSILNKHEYEDLSEGRYGVIKKRFDKLARKKLLYFGKKYGVSENAMFISAYNYCINLFSNDTDIFSNSIHSGRTDSRWNRLVGSLFETYYIRNKTVAHEKVDEFIKRTGEQIMNTMKCVISCPRQGEMFFQFQGDILETSPVEGLPTERVHVQLDSLPFHFQVMYDADGYYTELRFWENRFDKDTLNIFLDCYEAVLVAMLEETSVRLLKRHMPQHVVPKHYYVEASVINQAAGKTILKKADEDEKIKVYVFDESYNKKPYGAWGPVYIMNYEPENYTEVVQYPYGEGALYSTGLIGRILPDGTLDFMHVNGRRVLTDGIRGRRYYDLKQAEELILNNDGVKEAYCYMVYNPNINEMSLAAEVKADKEVTEETIRESLKVEDFDLYQLKLNCE